MTRAKLVVLISVIAVGCATLSLPRRESQAGCRAVAVRKELAVAYQPVYGQQLYYSVGLPLQYQALKEQIKAELRAEQLNHPAIPESSPETLPLSVAEDKWALVRGHCVSCHTVKEEAKAALDMSDLDALTCEQKLACIREIVDGTMPKNKPLDGAAIGDLIGTFSGSDKVGQ